MAQEGGEGDPHLLPRGARAGRKEEEGEPENLVVGEHMDLSVLVLHLGVDEHADQVVPGFAAAGLNDRLHDVDERRRGRGRPP